MRLSILLITASMLVLSACGAQNYSPPAKGALIGGALGADAGLAAGAVYGHPIEGTLAGGALGAAGGAAVGAGIDHHSHRASLSGYGSQYFGGRSYGDDDSYQGGDDDYYEHHWRYHYGDDDDDGGGDD